MLFAAVGVQVLGSETEETNLRTLLLPCYLQLLGCRCWGARRRRRICGGYRCFHSWSSKLRGHWSHRASWGGYITCWHSSIPLWVDTCMLPGIDRRVKYKLPIWRKRLRTTAAWGFVHSGHTWREVSLPGSLRLPMAVPGLALWRKCRLGLCQLCWECMATNSLSGSCGMPGKTSPLWWSDMIEVNVVEELLEAVREWWNARRSRRRPMTFWRWCSSQSHPPRKSGEPFGRGGSLVPPPSVPTSACTHSRTERGTSAVCTKCQGATPGPNPWRQQEGSVRARPLFRRPVHVLSPKSPKGSTVVDTVPGYLQLLGWRCSGARRRGRICGRCCCHAICSCWGGGAGERDYRDESADAAVAMLFAAVAVQVLGSETEETNLRTLLFPCYLQLLGWSCWGARRRRETHLRTLLLPCYLRLLGWRCWGARLPRRICGRCCCHAICSCCGAGTGERDGDESADAAVTMLFAAVGVEVLGARRRRRICGRCCYHAICSCKRERYGADASADAAVPMLFAAVRVEVLGSDTEETNLRTLLLPCYLQLLGWRCWGARLPRRICGRCCCHAICSCWGGGAGERDYRDESADAAVACYLQLLGWRCSGARLPRRICGRCCCHAICSCWGAGAGSEMEETNLRTLLLPCYLQLLGCRCWGARRRRRICGRCCSHAICSCWGGAAQQRDGGDESADAAVPMLFAAVGVEGGRRRICGRCCYHAICSCWGAGGGERYGGDESADAAVTMLFAAVGVQLLGSETEETNLRTLLFPCYLQLLGWSCWGTIRRRRICGRCCSHVICSCWGGGAGERDCGDESADGAVAMLFAAVGVEVLGSETAETNLRTVLLPCYLQLLGCSCWGAIRRRRICGRCCSHAICSCWGGGAGERDGGDESADAAVTMLFAAVRVQLLGSETAEMKLRTLLLPCELGIGVGGDGAADGGGGGCCCLNKRSLRGPDFGPLIF